MAETKPASTTDAPPAPRAGEPVQIGAPAEIPYEQLVTPPSGEPWPPGFEPGSPEAAEREAEAKKREAARKEREEAAKKEREAQASKEPEATKTASRR